MLIYITPWCLKERESVDFFISFIAGDLKQHPIIFVMVVLILFNQRTLRKELMKFTDWCLRHMELHAKDKE